MWSPAKTLWCWQCWKSHHLRPLSLGGHLPSVPLCSGPTTNRLGRGFSVHKAAPSDQSWWRAHPRSLRAQHQPSPALGGGGRHPPSSTLLPPQSQNPGRRSPGSTASAARPAWVSVMLSRPGATGAWASGLTRPWEWAGGLGRGAGDRASPRCALARGQVTARHSPQGAWADETAVLAARGLFHDERKHLVQGHGRCSVRERSLP